MFAAAQFCFQEAVVVDQHAAQSIAGRPSLPEAHLNQTALPGKHLRRQLPAVFAGHGPLYPFNNGRDRRAVVLELLGAVRNLNASPAADVLVIRALVGVLESPPSTNVVDEDDAEVCIAIDDIGNAILKCLAAVNSKTAFTLIGICADDLESAAGSVVPNPVALILGRILLVFGRHADVLRCAPGRGTGDDRCIRVIE